jgi:hypothetical protein
MLQGNKEAYVRFEFAQSVSERAPSVHAASHQLVRHSAHYLVHHLAHQPARRAARRSVSARRRAEAWR